MTSIAIFEAIALTFVTGAIAVISFLIGFNQGKTAIT